MKDKIVLGIAGFISSGKTEAGRYLERLGAGFIEADEVVNGLYRPGGDGYRKIASYFGPSFIKRGSDRGFGEINRKKLAKFVFSDPRKLKILNGLIHPLVNAEIRRLISRRKEPVVAVEAAYFDKGGLGGLVDKIIWISCPRPVLMQRALRGSGVDEEMFKKIIACQKRPERVDFVVANGGRKEKMFRRLKGIFGRLTLTNVRR